MAQTTNMDALRRLFLVCSLSGAGSILVGWFLESVAGFYPALAFTVVVPLLVMGGYIYAGLSIDETNASSEAFADSIYYLGFLLTLVALIFSLFAVDADGDATSGLVLRFGVALSTTVLGLGARTYFANFRVTSEDELRRLEGEVTRSMQRLRTRCQALLQVMTVQTDAFEASLQKANDDVEHASKQLSASASTLSSAVDDSASRVETSFGRLEEGTAAFARGLEEGMSTASSRLDEAAQDLSGKVEAVDLPPDLFTGQFAGPAARYAEKLDELTAQVEAQSEALGDLEDHNRQLARAVSETAATLGDASTRSAEGLEEAASKFENLIGQLEAATSRTGEMVTTFTRHQEAVSGAVEAVTALHDEVGEDAEVAARYRAALEEELTRSRKALAKMRGELLEAAEYIHDELTA